MNTTPHTDCIHPSTSAARAKCRKERAAATAAHRAELDMIIASFYDNSRDAEDIANDLHALGIKSHCNTLINAAAHYYDNSIEIETMIYDATIAKYEL